LELTKLATQKNSAGKKNPNKILLSLTKEPVKDQHSKTKLLDNRHSTTAKHHRKHCCSPMFLSQL